MEGVGEPLMLWSNSKSSSYGDPWPISDQLDFEGASCVTLISSHCMGDQPVRKGKAVHTHAY
jgi:hypothetical protein